VSDTGLALWHVGDPGNVGTILRCSDALGPAFVAVSAGCADPTGPKALRASMGAVFRVPLGAFENAPGRRVALVAQGGEPLDGADLSGPVTLVLGSEREGLPESVVRSSALRVSIPLEPGAESLNVAAAAAIALYERRRAHG
jgi:TrmH family RNA methyltransferase